jgi:hypothetical protein
MTARGRISPNLRVLEPPKRANFPSKSGLVVNGNHPAIRAGGTGTFQGGQDCATSGRNLPHRGDREWNSSSRLDLREQHVHRLIGDWQ